MELPGVATNRTLSEDELAVLVRGLAEDEARWRPLARFAAGHRGFEQLIRTEHVDVWVLTWQRGNDTGFHDHDVSSAAIAVVEGAVVEERLVLGGPAIRNEVRAGESVSLDATCIHRMFSESGEPAVTIHAYSPVPERNGCYEISADGTLHRRSQLADEELTPFAVA